MKASYKKWVFRGRKKQCEYGPNSSGVEGYSDIAKSHSSIGDLLFALYSFLFFFFSIGHIDILKQDKAFSFIVGDISY